MKLNKIIKTVLIIIVLFLVEFKFDLAEIALGSIIDWTNGMRPQSGEQWEKALRRQAAADELGILREQKRLNTEELGNIRFFSDAVDILETRGDFVITGNKFIELYKTLSRQNAEQVLAPLRLLRLITDESIKYCLFGTSGDNYEVILLNEHNEIIHQAGLPAEIFSDSGGMRVTNRINQRRFLNETNKIVTREIFYRAYNELTDNLKLQIVNDPFSLVLWGDRMMRAAIFNEEVSGAIPVIFEVRSGNEIDYLEFQARPLAVYYLIQQLNDLEEKTIR
ncbi:hypothetical protein ACFL6G_06140 [candidate division KSB1 bacterium]